MKRFSAICRSARGFSLLGGILSVWIGWGGAVRGADRQPPNFILINVDDLGYADIGPLGSKINRTPHLDRMAREGMVLKSHYAAPVCSPSRASLMTGCYPKRVLPIPHVLFPGAAVGLHPKEVTVAEVLKSKGYATACVGKWHLGDQPEFLPEKQGFDTFFGLPYSNDMGLASEGAKSDWGAPLPKPRQETASAKGTRRGDADGTGLRGDAQPPLPLLHHGKVVERVGAKEQEALTARYTEEALRFVGENRERPFFLYLAHTAVHFPIYPGKDFQNRSPHGIYSDWVEEVDWSVGKLLDALRELRLDEKTLVFFTSDNGGTPRAVNAPWRGHKASTLEGGMRVPTVAWWPGHIPAGRTTEQITSMMDILPTFAALAGAKLPTPKIDGGDLWPVLSGTEGAKGPHEEVFYYFRGFRLEAVRSGPWKLQLAGGDSSKGAEGAKGAGKGGAEAPADLYPRLFDLQNDPAESRNMSGQRPEVVARLQKLAEAMDGDLGRDGVGPGCRELGRVEKPKVWIENSGEGGQPRE
ncbi:MAG: hypothetical protein RLZZ244_1863 [Verrucomicrobiota bacterium]